MPHLNLAVLAVFLMLPSARAGELTPAVPDSTDALACTLALEKKITSIEDIDSAAQEIIPQLNRLRDDNSGRLMSVGEQRVPTSAGGTDGLGHAHNQKILELYKEFNAIGERLQTPEAGNVVQSSARALVRHLVSRFTGQIPVSLETYALNFAREKPEFERVGSSILEAIKEAEQRKSASIEEAAALADELRRTIELRLRVIDLMAHLEGERTNLPVDLKDAFDRRLVNEIARHVEDLDERAQSIEVFIKAKQTHLDKTDALITTVKRKVSLALSRIRQAAMIIDDTNQNARLLKAGNTAERLAVVSLDLAVKAIEQLHTDIDKADAMTSNSKLSHAEALRRLSKVQDRGVAASNKLNQDMAKRIKRFSDRTAELEKLLPALPPPSRSDSDL